MKSDAIIKVRFKTSLEGGRRGAVSGKFYGCPLFIDGQGFDCRLLLDGRTLELGATYEVPVKFLDPTFVLPKLVVGKAVILWEGKEIGEGEIVSIT